MEPDTFLKILEFRIYEWNNTILEFFSVFIGNLEKDVGKLKVWGKGVGNNNTGNSCDIYTVA